MLTHLDINKMVMKEQAVRGLPMALSALTRIEDLSMCSILGEPQTITQAYITNKMADALIELKTLRTLDLSKNKFHPETLDHLLSRCPLLP